LTTIESHANGQFPMATQMEEAIAGLKESPLFYLFLSSRELFHSNFWYWLSTLNPKLTVKMFSTSNLDSVTFKREHNQTTGKDKSKVDLLISSNHGPVIVIENKVKDFPTNEQLDRIKRSFGGNNNIEFILTTLFSTSGILFDGWITRTYRDISDSIIPTGFTQDRYYQKLIEDYKTFSSNLATLSDSLPIGQSYDFAISLSGGLFGKLNEIKLWEGYQKLRSSHLLHHYKPPFGDIIAKAAINNQKATLNFDYLLPGDYTIGIQIENTQFRKFVAGKSADKFAHNLLDNQIFFDNKFQGRGDRKFLVYGDNFRYQYTTMEGSITFSELFKRINTELQEIRNKEEIIKHHIPTR
jgi:hypothetical protein